jgi:hypothetical protein
MESLLLFISDPISDTTTIYNVGAEVGKKYAKFLEKLVKLGYDAKFLAINIKDPKTIMLDGCTHGVESCAKFIKYIESEIEYINNPQIGSKSDK